MDKYTVLESKLGFETLDHNAHHVGKMDHSGLPSGCDLPEHTVEKMRSMTEIIVEKLPVKGSFILKTDLPKVEILAASPSLENPFTCGDWFTVDSQTAKRWMTEMESSGKLLLPEIQEEESSQANDSDITWLSLPVYDKNHQLKEMIGVLLFPGTSNLPAIEEELGVYREILERDLAA